MKIQIKLIFIISLLGFITTNCSNTNVGQTNEIDIPEDSVFAPLLTKGDNETLIRNEIIARAVIWIDNKVPWSREPQPEWGDYRTDCSGFVSYAWGLSPPGRTTRNLDEVAIEIPVEELKPGDILNFNNTSGDGHAIIFVEWTNRGEYEFLAYEENGRFGYALERDDLYFLNHEGKWFIPPEGVPGNGPYVALRLKGLGVPSSDNVLGISDSRDSVGRGGREMEFGISPYASLVLPSAIQDIEWSQNGDWLFIATIMGDVYSYEIGSNNSILLFKVSNFVMELDQKTQMTGIDWGNKELNVILEFDNNNDTLFIFSGFGTILYRKNVDNWQEFGRNEYSIKNISIGKQEISNNFQYTYGWDSLLNYGGRNCIEEMGINAQININKINQVIRGSINWPGGGTLSYFRCVISPDNTIIISRSHFGQTALWDTKSATMLQEISPSCTETFGTLKSMFTGFSPDGKYFFTKKCSGAIEIWELESMKPLIKSWFEKIKFSANSKYLISYSYNWGFIVFDWRIILEEKIGNVDSLITDDSIFTYRDENGLLEVEFSPDGNMVATGWEDGNVLIFITNPWE